MTVAARTPTPEPHSRRWTREEYHRAAELGIFGPEERLELIDGEVLSKVSPIGTKHVVAVHRTSRLLETIAADRFLVRTQAPFIMSDESEPEPDICVVAFRDDEYLAQHPSSADVSLVVEVSAPTLLFDRTRKSQLYADAGIPEYWILNIERMQLEVYRDPQPGSGYRSRASLTAATTISPLFAAGTEIPVAGLLPLLRAHG